LPVRYKEFNRNIRREYGRLLSILQVNCLRLSLPFHWIASMSQFVFLNPMV
jgi:hypothetical protein